jgi:hypothetical protein
MRVRHQKSPTEAEAMKMAVVPVAGLRWGTWAAIGAQSRNDAKALFGT